MTSPVSISDIVLIAPHIGLFLFSLIPLLMKIHRGGQEANRLVTVFVALAGLIFAGVSTLVLNGPVQPMFGGALVRDGISVWTNFTMIVAASATLIISSETSGLVRRQFSEFVFVLLNTLIGMMVLSMSNDLITAFIAIEMMSLGLYMAIMLAREQRQSKEAAFKYFVLGSFASAILLYGISFIYGTVGSTYFGDIVNMAP
jgi:NADH-quinone oxidoreductase subunit N